MNGDPKPENEPILTHDKLMLLAELTAEDPEALAQAVRDFRRELRNVPKAGIVKDGFYVESKRTFVVPIANAEQRQRFYRIFSILGIGHWEESGLLIIERPNDLEKLRVAGLIAPREIRKTPVQVPPPAETEAKPQTELEVEQTAEPGEPAPITARVRPDEYRFPLAGGVFPKPFRKIEELREEIARTEEPSDEPEEMTEELQRIVDDFDAGASEEEIDRLLSDSSDMPTTALFPRKYVWRKKEVYHSFSGEPVTEEEIQQLNDDIRAVFEISPVEGEWWRMKEKVTPEQIQKAYAAFAERIRMHVGLAVMVAVRIRDKWPWANVDDLFQEGLIGMMRAMLSHDPKAGARFSTYAVIQMSRRMRSWIRRARTVYVPPHRTAETKVYVETRDELRARGEVSRPELVAAISDKFKRTYSDISLDILERRNFINAVFDPLDIDDAYERHVNTSMVDMTGKPLMGQESDAAEHEAMESQATENLYKAIDTVPLRNRFVLCARFGLVPKTPTALREFLVAGFPAAVFGGPEETESEEELFARILSHTGDKGNRMKHLPYYPMASRILTELRSTVAKYSGEIPDEEFAKLHEGVKYMLAFIGRASEKQIEDHLYNVDRTLDDVGSMLGVTRENIRQQEAKALRMMKHPSRSQNLRGSSPVLESRFE